MSGRGDKCKGKVDTTKSKNNRQPPPYRRPTGIHIHEDRFADVPARPSYSRSFEDSVSTAHMAPLHGSTPPHSAPLTVPPPAQYYRPVGGPSRPIPSSIPSYSSHTASHSHSAGSIGLSDLQLGGTSSGLSRMVTLEKRREYAFLGTSMASGPARKGFNDLLDYARNHSVKSKWIPKPIWPLYQRYWSSPEYQLLRGKGKKAWASFKGGSLHTAGARSALAVQEKMVNFMRLVAEYRSSLPSERQGDLIPVHVQNEFWTKAVGPANRGHYYGYHTEYFGKNIRSSSGTAYSTSSIDRETIDKLENTVSQLTAELAEQKERYYEQIARQKKTEEATTSQIRMLQEQFSCFIQTQGVIPPCLGDAARIAKGLSPWMISAWTMKWKMRMNLQMMMTSSFEIFLHKAFGTFGFDIHHRYSDAVKGTILDLHWLPQKGSIQYYSAWTQRDRHIISRQLTGTIDPAPVTPLTFSGGGSKTVLLSSLGFSHYANVTVGTPGLSFLVAVDTGSDLFWLPCNCNNCAHTLMTGFGRGPGKGPTTRIYCVQSYLAFLLEVVSKPIDLNIYNPNTSSTSKIVPCNGILCGQGRQCSVAHSACGYGVAYLSNNTSSSGVLVEDILHLQTDSTQQKVVEKPIAFGQTYNISLTGITVGNKNTDVDFTAIFDSGTSFTYLNDPAYKIITENFNSQAQGLRIQPMVQDGSTAYCLAVVKSGDVNMIGRYDSKESKSKTILPVKKQKPTEVFVPTSVLPEDTRENGNGTTRSTPVFTSSTSAGNYVTSLTFCQLVMALFFLYSY
ncbi:putative receptor-like protein 12-like [Capsicum annuum]|nr:putative receptor-like protein 12-like [Capsicum annuum]